MARIGSFSFPIRRAACAGLALLIWPGASALADDGCGTLYHAELETVRMGPFKALEAIDIAGALGSGVGVPGLPGPLSMTSPAGKTPTGLGRARRLAAQVAAGHGSRSLPATASTRWVAERIRTDLADYLGQKPTPYLCAGLAHYLGTLRDQAGQIALSDRRLAEGTEALRTAVKADMEATLAALRPVPAPRFAPPDRPGLRLAEPHLLPAIDTLGLEEQGDAGIVTRVAHRAGPAREEGLGFPPRPDRLRLDSRADLEQAARRLVFAARRGGVLSMPHRQAAAAAGQGAAAYIAAIAPALALPEAGLKDPLAAPALRAALADIEMLDVLLAAREGGADPVAAALETTMSGIEAAHAAGCGCRR